MKGIPCLRQLLSAIAVLTAAQSVWATDWPTYRADVSRSGATTEALALPLRSAWSYSAPDRPQTAWAGPDERTFEGHHLKHRVNYDQAFQPVVAGQHVYFGSTVDHHVWCLDLATGKAVWNFATEAPVRLAPTVAGEMLLFGSDDGHVYCLQRNSGRLMWKLRAGPHDERIIGRGEMISRWPIRTDVTVADGVAYFGAGIFPHEDVYLYAVNVADGKILWKRDTISASDAGRDDLSPQGYLLASKKLLFVPSGRSLPAAADRKTGELMHKASVSWRREGVVGGTRAVLAGDQLYSHGEHVILAINQETGRSGHAWLDGRQMAVAGEHAYLATGTKLLKVHLEQYAEASRNKKNLEPQLQSLNDKVRRGGANLDSLKAEVAKLQKQMADLANTGVLWSVPLPSESSLVVTANAVIAGGPQRIDVFATADGKRLWNTKVEGDVHGLAVANGHLIASTDAGKVYAFAAADAPAAKAAPIAEQQPPYPADALTPVYAAAADEMLKRLGTKRGFCLNIGAEHGRLAYELAKRSELKIYGVESDAEKAAAARKALMQAGLYGHRVVIHHGDLNQIPYSRYFANLIVSDTQLLTGTMPGNPETVARHLKPCDGKIVLGVPANATVAVQADAWKKWLTDTGLSDQSAISAQDRWAVLTRGRLPGAGDWSHQYAGPGNTAVSDDQRVKGGLGVLWFGDPGPGKMVNRHDGAVGPLAVNGRLVIQGQDTIMAYDAYNGTKLWERENPEAIRTGVFQNYEPGNLVASDDSVFVMVRDKVWQIDAATGEIQATHLVPDNKRADHEWGFVAYQDGILFGTATIRQELADRLRRRGRRFEDATDTLFAIDVKTGKHLWSYAGGSISHHTVALGPSRVFLIDSTLTKEQRDELLREDKTELRNLSEKEAKLAEERAKRRDLRLAVALDARTGAKIWEHPVDVTDCSEIGTGGGQLTLMHHNNVLVLCGANANGHYWNQFLAGEFSQRRLVCLSAEDGHKLWGKDANYRHRPIVVGDEIIAEPWAFDLYTGTQKTRPHPLTGEAVPWSIMRPGHHCGMLTGCANMLMFRSGYTGFFNLDADSGTQHFAGHRLGCWINAIPANGLVMIPEASAGCVCQFSIASTIVLEPREARRPWSIVSSVGDQTPVQRMALNLGAPGDRQDAGGQLWLAYPRPNPRKNTGLDLTLDLKTVFDSAGGYEALNDQATHVTGAQTNWLFTSWAHGFRKGSLPLLGKDDPPATYGVKLYFADLESNSKPGQRVFDVKIQGETVLAKFDPVAATNGRQKAVVKQFEGIRVTDALTIELVPASDAAKPPILNAIEVVRE